MLPCWKHLPPEKRTLQHQGTQGRTEDPGDLIRLSLVNNLSSLLTFYVCTPTNTVAYPIFSRTSKSYSPPWAVEAASDDAGTGEDASTLFARLFSSLFC